jgi:hypothetical protein
LLTQTDYLEAKILKRLVKSTPTKLIIKLRKCLDRLISF